MNKSTKILFSFYSNLLDEWIIETLWAEYVDVKRGLYRIDNIPFYASVACGDIVLAEYDNDNEMLVYKETTEYSGNSTIQVIILDEGSETQSLRKLFESLGCESEALNENYFVIQVPYDLHYYPIKQKLDELEKKGILSYAEPCISEKHYSQK